MQRLLAASLLLCLPMLAHAGDAAISTEQAKRIDDAVRAIMQVNDVPGATVLVADHGQVVYRQAYGMRDLKTRQPAAVDTTYEVGPITEQFTAAAILQLQEAGKLHLDDKLSVYLPDAPFADKVTLRQALTHSGGLPDYLAEIEDAKATGKPATFNELMGYIRDKPLRFPPGIHVEYSSTGYAMAGRVIEVVSHETYWHYLQNHLLAPAGMTHTFTVAEKNSIPGMATGYMQENDKRVPAPTIHASVGWAAGFLVTTVDDMQKWNRALQDGKIVSHADVALMSKPVETLDGFTTYGLGLTVDTLDGQSRVGHSGSSNGFVDANEYFPDQGMQIIAFTNALTRPAPAEMMTTAIFEIMHPDIAQAAMRPVPGEDKKITATVKRCFTQLQTGVTDASCFAAQVEDYLKAGYAALWSSEFKKMGIPTRFVFKGTRPQGRETFQNYVIYFGVGNQLKFNIAQDSDGKISRMTFN